VIQTSQDLQRKKARVIRLIYDRLFLVYGRQRWWPARTPFEVMVGAVLVQNTNWQNVEKAVHRLRTAGCLSYSRLLSLTASGLSYLIRPCGYHRVKAGRLRNLVFFVRERYNGSLRRMAAAPTERLREELLSVSGIGPETADSILLYAFNRPVFVVDAYTRRLLERHGFKDETESYDSMQRLFTDSLSPDEKVFNEYHALIVRLGKDFKGDMAGRDDYPLRAKRFFL
jgi:endonuclease-3 related protein